MSTTNPDSNMWFAHIAGWSDLKHICGTISHEITEGVPDPGLNVSGGAPAWRIQEPFSNPTGNNELCDYCNDNAKQTATGGSGIAGYLLPEGPAAGLHYVGGAGVATYSNGSYASCYWDDNNGGCRAPGSVDANRTRPKMNKMIHGTGPILKNAKLIWIFWGSQWNTQTTPSRAQILTNFSLLQQSQYYSQLQQYDSVGTPTYFLDVIYDDPAYPPDPNYRMFPKSLDPTGNPNGNRDTVTVIFNCMDKGLIPTPNYKGAGTQEEFIYIVLAPQGFLADPANMGYGAHSVLTINAVNKWNTGGTGGGGGGGGSTFTDVYNTTTGATSTGYWDLDGVVATRAGEQFEATSADIGKKITQAVLTVKKTGAPTGTASVVIRKGTDDSIAATIGTIDVTTIPATTGGSGLVCTQTILTTFPVGAQSITGHYIAGWFAESPPSGVNAIRCTMKIEGYRGDAVRQRMNTVPSIPSSAGSVCYQLMAWLFTTAHPHPVTEMDLLTFSPTSGPDHFSADIDGGGTFTHGFTMPVVVGHTYTREMKLTNSDRDIQFNLKDDTTGTTETVTYSSGSSYANKTDRLDSSLEYWHKNASDNFENVSNPSQIDYMPYQLSVTSYEKSTDHGTTYTAVGTMTKDSDGGFSSYPMACYSITSGAFHDEAAGQGTSAVASVDSAQTFTNTSNTYALAAGDKLLLEHADGSVANHISLKRTDAGVFDSNLTHGTRFVGSGVFCSDTTVLTSFPGTFAHGGDTGHFNVGWLGSNSTSVNAQRATVVIENERTGTWSRHPPAAYLYYLFVWYFTGTSSPAAFAEFDLLTGPFRNVTGNVHFYGGSMGNVDPVTGHAHYFDTIPVVAGHSYKCEWKLVNSDHDLQYTVTDLTTTQSETWTNVDPLNLGISLANKTADTQCGLEYIYSNSSGTVVNPSTASQLDYVPYAVSLKPIEHSTDHGSSYSAFSSFNKFGDDFFPAYPIGCYNITSGTFHDGGANAAGSGGTYISEAGTASAFSCVSTVLTPWPENWNHQGPGMYHTGWSPPSISSSVNGFRDTVKIVGYRGDAVRNRISSTASGSDVVENLWWGFNSSDADWTEMFLEVFPDSELEDPPHSWFASTVWKGSQPLGGGAAQHDFLDVPIVAGHTYRREILLLSDNQTFRHTVTDQTTGLSKTFSYNTGHSFSNKTADVQAFIEWHHNNTSGNPVDFSSPTQMDCFPWQLEITGFEKTSDNGSSWTAVGTLEKHADGTFGQYPMACISITSGTFHDEANTPTGGGGGTITFDKDMVGILRISTTTGGGDDPNAASKDFWGVRKMFATKVGAEAKDFRNRSVEEVRQGGSNPRIIGNAGGTTTASQSDFLYVGSNTDPTNWIHGGPQKVNFVMTRNVIDPTHPELGSFDHSVSLQRGYQLEPNDWRNVEITLYAALLQKDEQATAEPRINLVARSGMHLDQPIPPACSGIDMGVGIGSNGDGGATKEYRHEDLKFTPVWPTAYTRYTGIDQGTGGGGGGGGTNPCPTGQHKDTAGNCVPDVACGGATTVLTPFPGVTTRATSFDSYHAYWKQDNPPSNMNGMRTEVTIEGDRGQAVRDRGNANGSVVDNMFWIMNRSTKFAYELDVNMITARESPTTFFVAAVDGGLQTGWSHSFDTIPVVVGHTYVREMMLVNSDQGMRFTITDKNTGKIETWTFDAATNLSGIADQLLLGLEWHHDGGNAARANDIDFCWFVINNKSFEKSTDHGQSWTAVGTLARAADVDFPAYPMACYSVTSGTFHDDTGTGVSGGGGGGTSSNPPCSSTTVLTPFANPTGPIPNDPGHFHCGWQQNPSSSTNAVRDTFTLDNDRQVKNRFPSTGAALYYGFWWIFNVGGFVELTLLTFASNNPFGETQDVFITTWNGSVALSENDTKHHYYRNIPVIAGHTYTREFKLVNSNRDIQVTLTDVTTGRSESFTYASANIANTSLAGKTALIQSGLEWYFTDSTGHLSNNYTANQADYVDYGTSIVDLGWSTTGGATLSDYSGFIDLRTFNSGKLDSYPIACYDITSATTHVGALQPAVASEPPAFIPPFRLPPAIDTPGPLPSETAPVINQAAPTGGPVVGSQIYKAKPGGKIYTKMNETGSQGASDGIRWNFEYDDCHVYNRETTWLCSFDDGITTDKPWWSPKIGSHDHGDSSATLVEASFNYSGSFKGFRTERGNGNYSGCSGGHNVTIPAYVRDKKLGFKTAVYKTTHNSLMFEWWIDWNNAGAGPWTKLAWIDWGGDGSCSGSIPGFSTSCWPGSTGGGLQDTWRANGARSTFSGGQIVEIMEGGVLNDGTGGGGGGGGCPAGQHLDTSGNCVPDTGGGGGCPTGQHRDSVSGLCVPDDVGGGGGGGGGDFNHPGDIMNKWIGMKYLCYDDSSGNVVMDCWYDGPFDTNPTTPPNEWRHYFTIKDTGTNFGNVGDTTTTSGNTHCHAANPGEIFKWSTPYVYYAFKNIAGFQGAAYKWATVREIDTSRPITWTIPPCPQGQHRDTTGICVDDTDGGGGGGGGPPEEHTSQLRLVWNDRIDLSDRCFGGFEETA